MTTYRTTLGTVAPRRTVASEILRVLEAADEPMMRDAIIARMRPDVRTKAGANSNFPSAIRDLRERGHQVLLDGGLYRLARGQRDD